MKIVFKMLLGTLFSISFIFCIFPASRVKAATSGTCGDNLTWELSDGGKTLTISGTGEMYDYPVEIPPWDPSPYYIGSSEIKTVIISDGVTKIGAYAFSNLIFLENVTIGNSVTSIGEEAFSACVFSLKEITIPDSVTYIGRSAFELCKELRDVVVGDSVSIIENYAFYGCNSLETLTLPESLTDVGFAAFYGCRIKDIYYGGTEKQWNSISINWSEDEHGWNNNSLKLPTPKVGFAP